MNQDQQYFVHLLSSFVNQTEPRLENHVDWESLSHLAKIHSVGGIIAYLLETYPHGEPMDPDMKNRFGSQLYGTILLSTQKEYAMQCLMEAFDQAKIPRVLMKGYIVREYYPVKELRTFGDIDFLIKDQDRNKAHQVMIDLGYTAHTPNGSVWSYKKPNEYYEIHTDILFDMFHGDIDYVAGMSDSWEHTVLKDGEYSYEFTPEYHMLFLLLHLTKHFCTSGAGVRMFMDIALMLKKFPGLDWAYLWAKLKQFQLETFVQHILGLCGRWFDSPLPDGVTAVMPEDVYENLCQFILSAGTFGFYQRESTVSDLRKAYDKAGKRPAWVIRLTAVRDFCFPSYFNMRISYRFLDGRPYLLPLAWMVRVLKNIWFFNRKQVPQTVKRLTETDTAEAEKQFDLFSRLGLADSHNDSQR